VYLPQNRKLNSKIQKQMMEDPRPDQTVELNSGHLPMLSKPSELDQIMNNYTKFLCD